MGDCHGNLHQRHHRYRQLHHSPIGFPYGTTTEYPVFLPDQILPEYRGDRHPHRREFYHHRLWLYGKSFCGGYYHHLGRYLLDDQSRGQIHSGLWDFYRDLYLKFEYRYFGHCSPHQDPIGLNSRHHVLLPNPQFYRE